MTRRNYRLIGCGIAAGLAFVAHTWQEADNPILRYMSGFTMIGATAAGLAITSNRTRRAPAPNDTGAKSEIAEVMAKAEGVPTITIDSQSAVYDAFDHYQFESNNKCRKIATALKSRGYRVIRSEPKWLTTDAPGEVIAEIVAGRGTHGR